MSDGISRLEKSKGGRTKKKKLGGRPKKVVTVDDVMELDPSKPLPKHVEHAFSHIMAIKMKQSSLPNNSVQVATAGSQTLTFTPITLAKKHSQDVTKRTLSSRTKQSKEIMKLILGDSYTAVNTQTSCIVKSLGREAREDIIKEMNVVIRVTPEQVAAMKSCLGIPWNLFREMRRWLNTFKVHLASEELSRKVCKDWIGEGLRTEFIPVTVVKSGKTYIKLRAWSYIYNLVGYVLQYLDNLETNKLLVSHSFIPDSEIHLKIGGDHGGTSFKMTFQVANTSKPNSPENTIIFSIVEAKDYKANLRLCLERFRSHIKKFEAVTWKEKKFRLFFFGDYSFLCDMYGLSGASGRYCCLWCLITSEAMQIPIFIRHLYMASLRTLDTLKRDYTNFIETWW